MTAISEAAETTNHPDAALKVLRVVVRLGSRRRAGRLDSVARIRASESDEPDRSAIHVQANGENGEAEEVTRPPKKGNLDLRRRAGMSALGVQGLAADLDRFGGDQDNGNDAGRAAAVDPIMDRATLHQNVTFLQMDARPV